MIELNIDHPVPELISSEDASTLRYQWLICDPDLLGGKPVIRGTRLSAAFIFRL